MANGVIVPSQATWIGVIDLGGAEVEGVFEVFDSGGGWAFLFGKPLLRTFKAKHNFEDDTVTITGANNVSTTLENSLVTIRADEDPRDISVSLTLDVKQKGTSQGGSPELDPPTREVPPLALLNNEQNNHHPPPDDPVSEKKWTSMFTGSEASEKKKQEEEVDQEERQRNQMGGEDTPPPEESTRNTSQHAHTTM